SSVATARQPVPPELSHWNTSINWPLTIQKTWSTIKSNCSSPKGRRLLARTMYGQIRLPQMRCNLSHRRVTCLTGQRPVLLPSGWVMRAQRRRSCSRTRNRTRTGESSRAERTGRNDDSSANLVLCAGRSQRGISAWGDYLSECRPLRVEPHTAAALSGSLLLATGGDV